MSEQPHNELENLPNPFKCPWGLIAPEHRDHVLTQGRGFTEDDIGQIAFLDPREYLLRETVEHYDEYHVEDFKKLIIGLVNFADIKPSDLVVDLGCGTGMSTEAILKKSPRGVYALDPALPMLRELIKKKGLADEVQIVHGTMKQLADAPLERANKILAHSVYTHYHHLKEESVEFLREAYDYLPVGGEFVFSVESFAGRMIGSEPEDIVLQRIENAFLAAGLPEYTFPIKGVDADYDEEKVRKDVESSGGKVLRIKTTTRISPGDEILQIWEQSGCDQKFVDILKKHFGGKKIVEGSQYLFFTVPKTMPYPTE